MELEGGKSLKFLQNDWKNKDPNQTIFELYVTNSSNPKDVFVSAKNS